MSSKITESAIETFAIELLEAQGYQYIYGPDNAPDERGELDEQVVSSILEHTTQHAAIEGKTQTKEAKYYNLDAIIAVACSTAVGCGDFKKPETEDGAVQPITAAIQNACRRRNTGTAYTRGTLSAIPIFICNIANYMVDCMYDF